MEEEFNKEYESLKNGNISIFKIWLNDLSGEDIYNFIKWLQENNLKI